MSSNHKEKIKFFKIFLPFIILSLGLLVLYTFLNWLLIIKLELFLPKEMWLNFFIPPIITVIILLFFLHKRIRLFKHKKNSFEFYCFLSVLFIAGPVIIAQFYIENQQGKITVIEKPSQEDYQHQTLFYSIKKAQPLYGYGGLWVTNEDADKYGNEIRITCYFACPIVDPRTDSSYKQEELHTWIGVTFHQTFSNRRTDNKDVQERLINDFISSCIPKFNKYIFNTEYLRNLRNTNDRKDFMQAIEKSSVHCDLNDLVILEEEPGSYETRADGYYHWLIGTLIAANILWLLITFFTELDTAELNKFNSPKEKTKKKNANHEFLFLFIPSKKYWATPIIADLNIFMLVIMVFSGVGLFLPEGYELLDWGANFKPITANGQWWRLITSTFLHAGIIHLAYNMFALIVVGIFLESVIGSITFLIIYLITGFIASISSLLYNDPTICVGASGAIFGMYGILVALLLLKYIDKNLSSMLKTSVVIFIGLNLVMGFFDGKIDLAAHLGGLISGFTIGIIYFPFKKFLDDTNN